MHEYAFTVFAPFVMPCFLIRWAFPTHYIVENGKHSVQVVYILEAFLK